VSWTKSVTTCKQEIPKLSLPKAAPKPSYSHVVWVTPQACDPGKVSPDLSCIHAHDQPHAISRDKPVPLESHDLGARDPGNLSHDLPRDWSSKRSHAAICPCDGTHFYHMSSLLIGTWKTVGTINGVSNNQPSHKTSLHSTMT